MSVEQPGKLTVEPEDHLTFWNELVREGLAAEFVDLSPRTMQNLRQRGVGPRFVRLSARSIRYRRRDLQRWADDRLRASTSDRGLEGQDYEEPGVIGRPGATVP